MFWTFSDAGRDLAHLHLDYESVDPWPLLEEKTDGLIDRMLPKEFYLVEKMRFGKGADGKPDKTTIIYNSHLTLTRIPLEAYEYIVNGKSAIEWILDHYRVTLNNGNGIKNDPNKILRRTLQRNPERFPMIIFPDGLLVNQSLRIQIQIQDRHKNQSLHCL